MRCQPALIDGDMRLQRLSPSLTASFLLIQGPISVPLRSCPNCPGCPLGAIADCPGGTLSRLSRWDTVATGGATTTAAIGRPLRTPGVR